MFDPMNTPYISGWVKRSKIEIELSALIGIGYDLIDAQVGLRCWRNGIYILWLTHEFRLAIQSKGRLVKKLIFNEIIRVSNGLDPDQDRHSVSPDLGPNCLQRFSADDKICR